MAEKKERKTDRRTVYTRQVIKDSLLELMASRSFEKISVTAVCAQAEITRATFYLHYCDLWDVVNEILAEALKLAEGMSSPRDNARQVLAQIVRSDGAPEKLQEYDSLLPVCQRVAALPKYKVLFLDDGLSSYIVSRIFQTEKETMVPWLMDYCGICRDEAEMLFRFTIYGAFEVNKAMGRNKDKRWYHIQSTLLRFILSGTDALAKGKHENQ